jgi:hypothetical protein
MSKVKSSTDHLTLNADGTGKEIKFQCNGTEVAKINSTGFVGDGSQLTNAGVTTGKAIAMAMVFG